MLAALAALLIAQSPQSAPPPSVNERVVVTATASPVKERALGRAVTIITREEIEAFAGASLADALRLTPGIDVRARGEHGVQADFVLRGASFGQTLVLVDGVRLNNAQSGHHNADFPVPAAAIERVEVVLGPASAVHGADAFGGTVNLVTRTGGYREATAAGGSFDTARLDAAAGSRSGWAAAAWGSRSGGFMFDRDYATGGVRGGFSRGGFSVDAAHARKAFGANGFYGNSPSKEWTDLTRVAASISRQAGTWTLDVRGAYRNHGDRFRWDINRPGFAENRHRTDAVDLHARADRAFKGGARVTAGAAGGGDWIESSNLGDRTLGRGAVFTEAMVALGSRTALQAGVRADTYSTFGSAVSPSIAMSTWRDNGVRVRGSIGRAFRVPTYTERFYTDPNHSAQSELDPEHGWTAEAGFDVERRAWEAGAGAYLRWDNDVIDWVRESPSVRWRTTNVRDVETRGIELRAGRRFERGLVRVTYAWTNSEAPALTLLSKYVLDYTRHAIGAQLAAPLPGGAQFFARIDGRIRSDKQKYTLAGARVTRRLRRATLFVEGLNLLDEQYTEIPGVPAPPRAFMAGLTVR